MKTQILKPGLSAVIGLLLTAPSLYFILISVMKYVFGLPALFDAAQPALEALGSKEAIGWNINLLILFGPLVALLLNLNSVLDINWQGTRDDIMVQLLFQKLVRNWLVIVISGLCLLTLFVYAIGENCNCR
jgi:hypothetical protein